MTNPDLSIVIPVRDERGNLDSLLEELRPVLERLGRSFEILFIDDGSRDGSGEALDRMAGKDPRLRVLHFESPAGQTAALDAGFHAAGGAFVITMDSDGQNDPADIPLLLEGMGAMDAIVGYRIRRQDSRWRRLAARIANGVRNLTTGEDIIDTGCGLKAFRRDCLRRIHLYDGMHRFLPTLLRMEGCTVGQIPVSHRPRLWGSSKYTIGSRMLRAGADLLAVSWMKQRRLTYRLRGETRAVNGSGRSTRVG